MFSAITIRTQVTHDTECPLDIGYLLECLLFYQSVYVITSRAILRQLVNVFGWNLLEELLQAKVLILVFTDEMIAIHTGGDQIHTPVTISTAKGKNSMQAELRKLAIGKLGREGKGRRAAQRMEGLIQQAEYSAQFNTSLESLLLNHSLLESEVRIALRRLVPEFTGKFEFAAEKIGGGYRIHTDLDFTWLNALYHSRVNPSHSTLTPALFLSYACETETHLYFAARQLSEICVDPLGAELIECRFTHLAARSKQSESERKLFAALLLDDARAIREAFNSGSILIQEVVKVILRAGRFKEWLAKQNADKSLIRQYYKEIAKDSFIERLPIKAIRWAIFAGIDLALDASLPALIGKPISATLSLFDEMLLDKIAKGWKPNQFVDDQLIPLLEQTDSIG